MATSYYEHANSTILLFGVGSLVLVTIAFCMTFLGYALYCLFSRKAINWRAWRKPTAVLLIAFAVTLFFAFTLHIIVPALCLLVVGLFGCFFDDEKDSEDPLVQSALIRASYLEGTGPYEGTQAADPIYDTTH